MTDNTYLPILKWKAGEQQALKMLDPSIKPSIFPLIELLPESSDPEDPEAPPQDAFPKIVERLASIWGTLPIAIDVSLIEPEDMVSGTTNLLEYMFMRARMNGVQAVPVTGFDREPAHDAAVAKIVAADKRGVVVRVVGDEELLEPTLSANLQALCARLGVLPGVVDLVLDWGEVDPGKHRTIAAGALGVVAEVSDEPWRSVTFAAGSFPQLFHHVGAITITRGDWAIWQRLRAQKLGRRVRFGDYAIAHPVFAILPFSGAANIRYTLESEWLVFRGHKLTGPAYGGHAQFVSLAAELAAHPSYCGASFSWGDSYISQCAAGTVSTGNATTWRAVGTNHHLTFVARQLARVTAPSVAPGPPPATPGVAAL